MQLILTYEIANYSIDQFFIIQNKRCELWLCNGIHMNKKRRKQRRFFLYLFFFLNDKEKEKEKRAKDDSTFQAANGQN